MGAVLVLASLAVIVLGVWGYFVPAIVPINYFSTSQVLIVIFVILTITPLTALLLKSARTTTEMVWGSMPPRAGYALVLNAVMVILLMTLMGYADPHPVSIGMCMASCVIRRPMPIRRPSAMRLADDVFCTFFFCISWHLSFGSPRWAINQGRCDIREKGEVPHGIPAMAGGAPAERHKRKEFEC